jgi:prefoldin subunit 5
MNRDVLEQANRISKEIDDCKSALESMEGLLNMGMVKPVDVIDAFLDTMPSEFVRRLSALAIGMVQERKDYMKSKIENLNKELDEL